MKEYLYIDSKDDTHQTKFKVSQTPKLDLLIKEKKFDEALIEIDELLKTNPDSTNLNIKGNILTNLSRFEESMDCFNKALSIEPSKDIQLNKANSLYNWAKITFFPEANHDNALTLINEALDTLPDDEDPSEYYFLKAEIYEALNELKKSYECYLTAYKEFDRLTDFKKQSDYLENTEDTLFNIVGSDFYSYTPKSGDIINLVKDSDNEHDPDAIAVLVNDKLVSYVANNPYTLIDEVKSASDIKNLINENQKAEILFIYMGEYVIAKLL